MNEVYKVRLTIICLIVSFLLVQTSYSATYYWDTNDSTAGFGNAGGTWSAPTTNNATQGWSTSSAGTAVMSGSVTTASTNATTDLLYFGTNTAGLGAGAITVSGNVSAGRLYFGSASGAIVLSGGNITLANSSLISNPTGGGTQAATHTIGSNITVAGGGLQFGAQSTANERYIINGRLSGGFSLDNRVQNNTGYTELNNSGNSFTGNISIITGDLRVASVSNAGVNSAMGAGSSISQMGGGAGQQPAFVYTGVVAGSTNRPITTALTGTAKIISQEAALTLTGNISGGNQYAGTLGLSGDAGGGSNFNEVSGRISGIINVQVNSQTPVGGTGELGVWKLSGNNTYSGVTQVQNSSTLILGHAKGLGFGGVQRVGTGNTTVDAGSTLDLNGVSGINEAIVLNGSGTGGVGVLINNSGTTATIETGIANLAVAATGSGSGYSAAPTVAISGTGSGATAVASLGLTTASFTSISSGGTNGWAVNDTLSVTGGGGSQAVARVTSVNGSGQVTGLQITTAGFGYSGSSFTLAKTSGNGTGTVTVVGNSGNFTVGGLQLTNAGSGYTGTPTFTFNGGAATVTPTLSSVRLATTSTIGGTGNITINTVVSGTGGLTKAGTGTLTLGGNNTYSGVTSINLGTLEISSAGRLGSGSYAGNIVNSGTLIYGGTNNQTLSGIVSGTGVLTHNASSTLTLSGNNTYNGATTINSGTLNVAHVKALGNSTTVNINGGTLLVGVDDSINGMQITLNGTVTNVATLAFNGNYNGTIGALTLQADSILDLGAESVTAIINSIINMDQYILKVYSWTGTTLSEGGNGTDVDRLLFGRSLTAAELNNIQFYGDSFGNDFLGTGYEVGFVDGFAQVIPATPVPEPETWATAVLLLLGAFVWAKNKTVRLNK